MKYNFFIFNEHVSTIYDDIQGRDVQNIQHKRVAVKF
jgi:hypothetical protein